MITLTLLPAYWGNNRQEHKKRSRQHLPLLHGFSPGICNPRHGLMTWPAGHSPSLLYCGHGFASSSAIRSSNWLIWKSFAFSWEGLQGPAHASKAETPLQR